MGGTLKDGDSPPCQREVGLDYADIARIATTLAIAPLSFVALTAPAPSRPTLDLARSQVGLALRHHRDRCVFLLELATLRPLCGLGALAPAACRAHPGSPLPTNVDRSKSPSRQAELEARWRERVSNRLQPLDPETALSGLLAMLAEAP